MPDMKPILFNTPMVQAILQGRKTSTRRLMNRDVANAIELDTDGSIIGVYDQENGEMVDAIRCARYRIGDVLYVRETWCERMGNQSKQGKYIYRAHTEPQDEIHQFALNQNRWRPSLHMPKEAARIFLRVTSVRAERLREITDAGCKAEGIVGWSKDGNLYKYAPADDEGDYPCWKWSESPRTPQEAMQRLWDSTIPKVKLPTCGWEADPWVWVYNFQRISKEEAMRDGADSFFR